MPKRTTTAALSLLSKNDEGEIVIRLNAKAAPGSTIEEASVDWGDDEFEEVMRELPCNARHAYVELGEKLIIFSVRDSRGRIVSEGLDVLVGKEIVIPPVASVEITELVPNKGPKGSQVEIRGSNFGAAQDSTTLKMDDVSMQVQSWSDIKIVAMIP